MHQTWRTELDAKAGEAPIPHEETLCWDGWAAPCAVSGVRKHIHSDVSLMYLLNSYVRLI